MHTSKTALAIVLGSALVALCTASGDVSQTLHPGALGGGVTLLPNGWKIAPAGRHRRRREDRARRRYARARSCVGRTRVPPRRPPVVRVGRRQQHGARAALG